MVLTICFNTNRHNHFLDGIFYITLEGSSKILYFIISIWNTYSFDVDSHNIWNIDRSSEFFWCLQIINLKLNILN